MQLTGIYLKGLLNWKKSTCLGCWSLSHHLNATHSTTTSWDLFKGLSKIPPEVKNDAQKHWARHSDRRGMCNIMGNNYHAIVQFSYLIDLQRSCTNTSTFQASQDSPSQLNASLRLSSTSANHRTSLTSCITYSGSTPGAPTRWDVNPMLLRGLGFLELRPKSQVLVDPADKDPLWALDCLCRVWVCWSPPPPLLLVLVLLLLFRSIPAATAAATLFRGYSRTASPWIHQSALVPGRLKDRVMVKDDAWDWMCGINIAWGYFHVITETLTCYSCK